MPVYLKSSPKRPKFPPTKRAYDPEAARFFLNMLDPPATASHFVAVADGSKHAHKNIKPDAWYCAFNNVACELVTLNRRGAAIYIVVNRTDGTGRKAEHIVWVRAVFADIDRGMPVWPLQPSIIVETSPGKWQVYWLLLPDERLELDLFNRIMAVLVSNFRADPHAKDVARILRLPGFVHQKEPTRPHMVRVVGGTGKRHTVAELVAAFPPLPPKPIPPPAPPLNCPTDPDRMRRYALGALRLEAEALAGLTEGRRIRVFHAACSVAKFAAHNVLSASEISAALIAAWVACGADTKHGRPYAMSAIRRALVLGANDALPDLNRKNRQGSKS